MHFPSSVFFLPNGPAYSLIQMEVGDVCSTYLRPIHFKFNLYPDILFLPCPPKIEDVGSQPVSLINTFLFSQYALSNLELAVKGANSSLLAKN